MTGKTRIFTESEDILRLEFECRVPHIPLFRFWP